MGDRVAVMRKGELQQVADAAGALRPAGQPVRRRVHRQPGDEHARGDARARERRHRRRRPATSALALDEETLATRPALAATTSGGRSSSASGPRISRTRRSPRDAPADRRLHGQGRAAGGARLGDHGALRRRRAAGRAPRRCASSPQDVGDERRAQLVEASATATIVGRFGAALARAGGRDRRGRRRHAGPALLRPGDRARHLRGPERRKEPA